MSAVAVPPEIELVADNFSEPVDRLLEAGTGELGRSSHVVVDIADRRHLARRHELSLYHSNCRYSELCCAVHGRRPSRGGPGTSAWVRASAVGLDGVAFPCLLL